MSTASISITVDTETAERFAAVLPQDRRKVELLLGLRLRELTASNVRPLTEIMNDIGGRANAAGLTLEAVEKMFADE